MVQQIDHIVIAVRDLETASADYANAGFTVTPGGEHTGGATHNALVSFRDGAYFELIAFKNPDQPQEHRWWSLLSRGEGLVDYALLSKDLIRESARLNAADVEAHPRDGGRLRPDGQQVVWRTVGLKTTPNVALPFVIEDITPRDLRVPNGVATVHANDVVGVAGVTVVVADLPASAKVYAALLETEGDAGDPANSLSEGVSVSRRFKLGDQWIELVQPSVGSELAEHLTSRGEGPYQIELRKNGTSNGTSQTLPTDATHGARIRLT